MFLSSFGSDSIRPEWVGQEWGVGAFVVGTFKRLILKVIGHVVKYL